MGEARRRRLAAKQAGAITNNQIVRAVVRDEREVRLTLSFERPPTKDDIRRVRLEIMPWDIAESFALRLEHNLAESEAGREKPMLQLGLQWQIATLDSLPPEAWREVQYACRLFMDMGDPSENAQELAMASTRRMMREPSPTSPTGEAECHPEKAQPPTPAPPRAASSPRPPLRPPSPTRRAT